jgi:hypothetical protein
LCDEFDTSSVICVNDTARPDSYRDVMATAKEEVMKVKGSRRLVKRLGLALAVAALAAPAAQAVPMNPDTYQVMQSRQYADDLRVAAPTGPVSTQPRRYADDLHAASPVSEPRGYAPVNVNAGPPPSEPVSSVVADDSSSFSWGDAGIGAAFAIGLLILLGTGVLLAGRHTRRERLAAT